MSELVILNTNQTQLRHQNLNFSLSYQLYIEEKPGDLQADIKRYVAAREIAADSSLATQWYDDRELNMYNILIIIYFMYIF